MGGNVNEKFIKKNIRNYAVFRGSGVISVYT